MKRVGLINLKKERVSESVLKNLIHLTSSNLK